MTQYAGNEPLTPIDFNEAMQQSNRQKYQAQLAQAFGIEPKVENGLSDYIGDLIRSIYEQS